MSKSKRSWDARDWWFFISLLSLGQACIWFLSYHYGTNSSALGYISFAGTLISIILAVLAIGYTYGESHQQKNSSITLANQIESLVEIKDKLEIQADALTDIQSLKSHIIELSNKLDISFKETNSNITSFKDLFSDKNSDSSDNNGTDDLEGVDRGALLEKIIGSKPSRFTKLIIVVSLLYFEQRKTYGSRGFTALKDFFKDNNIDIPDKATYNLIFGATNQLALILNRCGYLKIKSGFVDTKLLEQFNSIVNKDLNELEDAFNSAGVQILEFAKTSEYYKKS